MIASLVDTFITHLQLFGIGFSLHFVGPCFFSCAPILGAFIAGKQDGIKSSFKDLLIFFAGRLLAYIILGFLAGLSGVYLNTVASAKVMAFSSSLAGALLILMGVYIFFYRVPGGKVCNIIKNKMPGSIGLFILGIIVGIVPCGPLTGILFQVVIMSKTAFEGLLYLLSFGLGITLSGLIVFGLMTGVLSVAPRKIIKSPGVNFLFKLMCSLLLVFLGLRLLISPVIL